MTLAGMGKSVLITGCSSGIGYCVAHGLRERGYRVFPTARQQKDVERLAAEGFASFRLDLSDSASIRAAVAGVLAITEGKLFALFNNGAFGQPGAVEDLQRDVLRAQFEVNLFGWHELTCLVLPVMRQQGYGRIVQNSSMLGLVALSYRGAYNASKYALEGLTDTLRLELEGSGIYVSLIEPGPVVSHFRANAYAAFKQHIDVEASAHRESYRLTEQRLSKPSGSKKAFTLPPEAVLAKVIAVLERPRPKVRYYVTVPAHAAAILRRVLPARWLDAVLLWVSRRENR